MKKKCEKRKNRFFSVILQYYSVYTANESFKSSYKTHSSRAMVEECIRVFAGFFQSTSLHNKLFNCRCVHGSCVLFHCKCYLLPQ